ncbi:peroxidasin isoform X2 [Cryptotermes secundus]|uniref:peroxidasin isoform X2 n=1 Tax=Cryptotermes secundus TaxID=105785 RepID=UPI000CD7C4AF|nr:peroxidasin isoform X2 [Cryptotermes secundus]
MTSGVLLGRAVRAVAVSRAMRERVPPGQRIVLVLLVLPSVLLATSLDKGRRELPHRHAEWQQLWYSNFEEFQRLTEPNFDNNTISNITVQLGATAFLHCRVRNLGERTISWVRRRDWHILTSGMFTYTNDERFQVLHSEGSDDWTLQIKYVQKRDNGTYECQISTGTGIMSHFVDLHIVVPEAFILGSGEHHVDVGSGISLVCIIEKSPTPPQYVFWYHNDRMINYDTSRGGITVETEPGPKTQSRLTIRDAHDTDSGNYTCSASNTEPASIYVFVSEGDKMAAILRRKTSSGSGIDVMLWFVMLPLLVMATR